MPLTEKQKNFAREYFTNGGNATQAYLFAYDSNSERAASIEASRLLDKPEIQAYIGTLNKPLERAAIAERETKRQWLWNMINNSAAKDSDRLTAMQILCKMDQEFVNINANITTDNNLQHIDIDVLKRLTSPTSE
jgi:phage terminase small subunit